MTQGRKVLLAAPRGYCAGVDRAVVTVEKALALYGPPVYVRKQIVHNKFVVHALEERGAIFVDEVEEIPEGSTVIFSAHGVAPVVHEEAAARNLKTIDATCPLVTKVHAEARRFANEGYQILLVGHEGHEEVVGTMGEAPDAMVLVEDSADAERVTVPENERLVWLSQTTLSVDETLATVGALKERFPHLVSPPSDDICYATQNRQAAVKAIAEQLRRHDRRRLRQLVQLRPAGRGGPRGRREGVPTASTPLPSWTRRGSTAARPSASRAAHPFRRSSWTTCSPGCGSTAAVPSRRCTRLRRR